MRFQQMLKENAELQRELQTLRAASRVEEAVRSDQLSETDSLIQELRYHARHSKDGKMSEECIVPKTLLADAADQLKKFCQTRAGNGNSLDGSPTTG